MESVPPRSVPNKVPKSPLHPMASNLQLSKDFNIVAFTGSGVCKKMEFDNIRRHIGIHRTARFWQGTSYTLHIDRSHSGCNFDPRSGSVSSEEKITLVLMESSAPSSVERRGIIPPLSDGLELICELHVRGSFERDETRIPTPM